MKAKVTEVKANYTTPDNWGNPKQYAGYVAVEAEDGTQHCFMNGSMNRVKAPVQVGDTGTLTWTAGGTYNLPVFTRD